MNSPDCEDTRVTCHCGLQAKLRASNTARNPSRLFYVCSKYFEKQCGFFAWADEPALVGDRNMDEMNVMRHHCNLLKEKLENVEEDLRTKKRVWRRKMNDTKAKLSAAEAELAEIMKKIKLAYESDLMPPIDRPCAGDSEGDKVKVLHTV